jgi:hypothetical protein
MEPKIWFRVWFLDSPSPNSGFSSSSTSENQTWFLVQVAAGTENLVSVSHIMELGIRFWVQFFKNIKFGSDS